jgi:DNA repair exonuclease SbcCD nuclease subunit
MKLLCCGDLHIRATAPRYRTDNYLETQMRKLQWIFATAEDEGCEIILQPGDFFDSPTIPNHLMVQILNLLYDFDHRSVHTVFGQHDLRYRNVENSALSVIETAGGVATAREYLIGGEIAIYPASWEKPIPEVTDTNAFNILLIHRMIVKDKTLWPGQKDYTKAAGFMRKHKDFDLVVSGDNHQSFDFKDRNRWLINCGSMMRMTTDQQDHKPCIWIFDTETKGVMRHLIPIEEGVFSPEAAIMKERNKELEAFIATLKQDKTTLLSFNDNVQELLKEKGISTAIKELVEEFMEGYYGDR